MDPIFILGILGILASLYAIYVEKRFPDKNYRASCDIGPNASCTFVLSSEYAHLAKMWFKLDRKSMFNVPNTYYGFLFYVAVTLYSVYPFTLIPLREFLLFGASCLSILMSIVLAWILMFRLKNFCAICVTTYVINVALMYYAYAEVATYF